MFSEDILIEIDSTLDQLICNAEAIQATDLNELSEIEIEAFKKTQESLVHHLIRMDEALNARRKSVNAQGKIQKKRIKFETLKQSYQKNLSKAEAKTPILSKRRGKRFFSFS